MAILGIADNEITMQEFIDKSYNTQKSYGENSRKKQRYRCN